MNDRRTSPLRTLVPAVLVVWLSTAALGSGPLAGATNAVDPPKVEVTTPEDVGMSSERLERLSAAMKRYIDDELVAGTVTLVARRGEVVLFHAQGHRDREAQQEMTKDTIFRIASMTKPIASIALMMLWEEGHFQLRDPISKFLPAFAEMDVATPPAADEYHGAPYKRVPARGPITMQHVLTHTSGFPNSYHGLTRPDYVKMRSEREPGERVGDMVARLAELPLNFEPGTAWQYGPSTDVVGHLVEVISGQTLAEFLGERIFGPLGMVDTHFYLPEEKLDRFAALYRPSEEDQKIELAEAPTKESRYLRQPQNYFSGGGGLVSTAQDYFRFHQMMLNGGELDGVRLLSPKTVELITANHIGDLGVWLRGPGYGFGLGYSVVTDLGPSSMPAKVGSYSWGGAFCTAFWVDPEEELIGILMTQVRPYTHLNIRADLQSLAYQAIVE